MFAVMFYMFITKSNQNVSRAANLEQHITMISKGFLKTGVVMLKIAVSQEEITF